jgi:hypothetical protein
VQLGGALLAAMRLVENRPSAVPSSVCVATRSASSFAATCQAASTAADSLDHAPNTGP